MKQLRGIFVTLAALSLLTVPLVGVSYAQEDVIEEQPETTETDRLSPEERAAAADERRAQREADREEAIDTARAERAATRCEAAQEKIQAAVTRAQEVESNRQDVYSNVSSKVADIVTRLDAAGIDSSELSNEMVEYENLVAAFFADFDTYQLALEDAAAIDCVEDTEGFLLALEEARTLRASLKESAAAIRSYVTGTIIDTLNQIKDSLETDGTDDAEASDGAASEEEA